MPKTKKTSKKKTAERRRPHTCGLCHREGHSRRTCPEAHAAATKTNGLEALAAKVDKGAKWRLADLQPHSLNLKQIHRIDEDLDEALKCAGPLRAPTEAGAA